MLPTRDRLQNWGMNVVSTCLLCGISDENRDHLFFRCSYSQELWTSFFSNSTLAPPADFEAIIAWLPSSSSNAKVKTICHLLVQALVYVVWKERNTRLHTSASKPPLPLVKEIKGVMKAKLFGLDRVVSPASLRRAHPSSSPTETYLQLWFRYFDP